MPPRPEPPEPKKNGAPAYIVSMSALWTILLSFFILMCTMAEEKEAGFIAAGTGSFVRELEAFGLPGLLRGTRNAFTFGVSRPVYSIRKEDTEPARANEGIGDRRVIKAPDKRLENLSSLGSRKIRLRIPTSVKFKPGSSELDWQARRELDSILKRIRNTTYNIAVEAYVAPDFSFVEPPTDQRQVWILSARRAPAITKYFHERGGIPDEQLMPVGYGSHRPGTRKRTTRNAQINDRIIVVICDE